MQAEFGIKRESNNSLFYNEWQNDKGVFHFHSQIELYFVNDGEMIVSVGDKVETLKGGEMSVALSFTPHGYKTPQSSTSGALIIPTYLCEDFITATHGKRAVEPFIRNKATVSKIKEYIREILSENTNEIERRGYIFVILGMVMREISLVENGTPSDESLASKLLFYINKNYKNGITPASIAAHLGYTQSHISRYFKSHFNVTMLKYLNMIRLKNAIMLMYEKRFSITYCALESGFASIRTFYRAFFDEFGCSPKEYLKRI